MSAPTVIGPEQLPDLRLWLTDQWRPGRTYARHAAALLAHGALYNADQAGRLPSALVVEGREARKNAEWEHDQLRAATLWWVAPEMVDLLLASAAGMPDDVKLGDLPKLPGSMLVVFGKPWRGIDVDPRNARGVQVDAMLVGAAHLPPIPERPDPAGTPCVSVSSYRVLDFDTGLDSAELQLAAITGAITHGQQHVVAGAGTQVSVADHVADRAAEHGDLGQFYSEDGGDTVRQLGHDDLTHVSHTTVVRGSTWCPLGRSDWPAADPIGAEPWPMDKATLDSYVEDRKVVAALWHLLHQEGIAQQEVHYSDRPTRRRTERTGLPKEAARVQVVTLRKLHRTESAPSDEHAHVEWTHRWLVAGHWRWQPCGPARAERRLTFVRPHVKGPDHLPLRVPERVNAWVR